MRKALGLFAALFIIFGLVACSGDDTESKDGGAVNLYTGRHYDTDQVLYDRFTEDTGIEVNVIEGKNDELIARLEREGEATEADLFITADAGRLHRAKEQGLLQPVESDILAKNIPEKYRDTENEWFGLTKRARVIAYHKERVDPETIETYEDVLKPEFKDELLIRSSENVYNQSLVASFIALNGEEETKAWADGIVKQMAREPKGGDTDQAIALAAGEGDIAIINSYYYGRMLDSEDEATRKAGEQLDIIFPDQDGDGTHVNISGISLVKSSKNKENAIQFMEYLTEEEQQSEFSSANFEYPVNPDVEPSELLQSWGEFKEQDLNLTELGLNNAEALRIMNEVGWK